MKKKAKVLLLCAGPNDRDQSIYKLLVKAGFEVDNFDLVNGDGNDIADKAVFDRICRAVTAKDYVAAFASPDCSTFSNDRNMPGGPPPVRGIEGRDRYGLKFYGTRVTSAPKQPLSREDKENVRYHTLVAVRVAFILDLCWTQTIPFGYETPERCAGQVSMLHLDEYIALLARPGVKHKVGFQCPFDGVSAKPTSWVYFGINFDDIPDSCPHTKRLWFNTRDGYAISKRHRHICRTSVECTWHSQQAAWHRQTDDELHREAWQVSCSGSGWNFMAAGVAICIFVPSGVP